MLPVLQAGVFQEEQKEETRTMVNAQIILENIAPVPSSTSLKWKTATDLISRDREDAAERLSREKSELLYRRLRAEASCTAVLRNIRRRAYLT